MPRFTSLFNEFHVDISPNQYVNCPLAVWIEFMKPDLATSSVSASTTTTTPSAFKAVKRPRQSTVSLKQYEYVEFIVSGCDVITAFRKSQAEAVILFNKEKGSLTWEENLFDLL